MSNEKSVWKDVVAVAKFMTSCLGLVASAGAFAWNLGLRSRFFEKCAGVNDYKGKEKVC